MQSLTRSGLILPKAAGRGGHVTERVAPLDTETSSAENSWIRRYHSRVGALRGPTRLTLIDVIAACASMASAMKGGSRLEERSVSSTSRSYLKPWRELARSTPLP